MHAPRAEGCTLRAPTVALRTPSDPEALCARLSLAIPLALFALGASDSMGLYDAPELASSGALLGVTHPPGHPLFVVLASLSSLVPVGPLAMRVSLLGGALTALAARAMFGVALSLARAALAPVPDAIDGPAPSETPADPHARWLAPALALGAALTGALGPAVFRQTTRAEVYALAITLGALLLAACSAPRSDAWRARWAVLLLGLAGTNHTFIAVTTAPIAIAAVVQRLRGVDARARLRSLAVWAALGALAMLPYALLPLRRRSPASMVRVRTAGDMLWTVSARAFQGNVGSFAPEPWGVRVADLVDVLGGSVTPIGLIAGVAGALILLRRKDLDRTVRRALAALLLALAVPAVARAYLGFIAGNPDAAGYVGVAALALGALTAGFTATAWRVVRDAPPHPEGPTPGARIGLRALLVAAPALLPLWLAPQSLAATEADRGRVSEAVADALLTPLPPRAVLVLYSPDMVFRARYATLVEGERPDVSVVAAPFLSYPGATNALLARDPELLPLVRDFLAHGAPQVAELAGLATQRPVRAEVHPWGGLAVVPFEIPRGLSAEVRGEPTTLAAVRATAPAHFSALDALEREIAAQPGSAQEVRVAELVLWRRYNDTIFFAARGARAEARTSLAHALARSPSSRELLGLQEVLSREAEGPVDVRPFLVGPRR